MRWTTWEEGLWIEAGIRVHQGKTQICTPLEQKPQGCDALNGAAVAADPSARMKVLGTPWSHTDLLRAHLVKTTAECQVLFDRIPLVEDFSVSMVGLGPLSSRKGNVSVPSGRTSSSCRFLQDRRRTVVATSVCCCSSNLRSGSGSHHATRLVWCGVEIGVRVSKPRILGELGGFVGRDPPQSNRLVKELEGLPTAPFLRAAADAKKGLIGTMWFEPPSWKEDDAGMRQLPRDPEDIEPGTARQGWQRGTAFQRGGVHEGS